MWKKKEDRHLRNSPRGLITSRPAEWTTSALFIPYLWSAFAILWTYSIQVKETSKHETEVWGQCYRKVISEAYHIFSADTHNSKSYLCRIHHWPQDIENSHYSKLFPHECNNIRCWMIVWGQHKTNSHFFHAFFNSLFSQKENYPDDQNIHLLNLSNDLIEEKEGMNSNVS